MLYVKNKPPWISTLCLLKTSNAFCLCDENNLYHVSKFTLHAQV